VEQRWDAGGGERKVEKAHLETGVIKDRFITMFYGMGEVFGLLF
jgi:hypothetical protein